MELLLTRN